MDARRRDAAGLTICPTCEKHYKPVLGDRDPDRIIQEQFPEATPEQREQLITGICSNACYPGGMRFVRPVIDNFDDENEPEEDEDND